MKVKATKVGFYGELRKVNDEFTISSKKDLGSWMEEVKAPAKAKAKAKEE